MSAWGLNTGDDVGLAVDALLKEGLMQASAEDSAADFAGVGPLADLMNKFAPNAGHVTKQNRFRLLITQLLLGLLLVSAMALLLWLLRMLRGW